MAFSRCRIAVSKCVAVAGRRISVVAFQNTHGVVILAIFNVHHTRNTRCIIRTIRLKLSGSQCLFKSLLLVHQFIDRICLISVSHDSLVAQHPDRCINDQTWIT